MPTAVFAIFLVVASDAAPPSFDHSHAAWTELLGKHVVVANAGRTTRVHYATLSAERGALGAYCASLSAVQPAVFKNWTRDQRLAFLINAYNAFTVELVLRKYPNLSSIRDYATLVVFNSPWKKTFIPLLGSTVSLDDIEHGMLRARGAYDEPRVHFAVNCASVGCPGLREEAYSADRLDAQLEDQARRFLSDRSRNRFNPKTRTLEVSAIFKWFGEDWRHGHRGIGGGAPIASVESFLARYAALLADAEEDQRRVAGDGVRISYLDYDWSLNDVKRTAPR